MTRSRYRRVPLYTPHRDTAEFPEGEAYVISHVVGHQLTRDDTILRVRWYGHAEDDDRWDPKEHIPRINIFRYCRREKVTPDVDVLAAPVSGDTRAHHIRPRRNTPKA